MGAKLFWLGRFYALDAHFHSRPELRINALILGQRSRGHLRLRCFFCFLLGIFVGH